ncbi:hypothetical protein KKC45_03680 [Patescibacteria group bacterium]|nr:hypothetical protein [Patescibacteria group bacterium]
MKKRRYRKLKAIKTKPIKINRRISKNIYPDRRSRKIKPLKFRMSDFIGLGQIKTSKEARSIFENFRTQFIYAEKSKSQSIRIDMDDHTGFDPAALMYFIKLIYYANNLLNLKVSGTFPKTREARRQLIDIGFIGRENASKKCVSLIDGDRPSRKTAKELAEFLADQLIQSTSNQDDCSIFNRKQLIQKFYGPFFELMQNVYAHAGEKRKIRWHAFGLFDEKNKKATAVVGDLGIGIRKSFSKKEPTLKKVLKSDSQFIRQVLIKGISSHPGKGRGKGLKELRRLAEEGAELTVLSGRGLVFVTPDGICDGSHLQSIPGTIVVFSITKGDCDDE